MKAFVFDLDGVIAIGGPFTAALQAEHGIAAERWIPFFAGPFPDCLVGRRDLREELAATAPQLGWAGPVDALMRFWFDRENIVCAKALACVATLRSRGHACYLGTNQERHRARYIVEDMGLGARFDGLFTSASVGYAKPSPDYFAAITRSIGQADLLLVDDSAKNIAAAAALGWAVVHYRGPADLDAVLAAVHS